MKRQHNLLIGERSAEKIKIEVGSAMTELKDAPEDLDIRGEIWYLEFQKLLR